MKKQFFAQSNTGKARYFDTQESAREWLCNHGGGTIKERNTKVVYSSGDGLAKVTYDSSLRTWGVIETVESK